MTSKALGLLGISLKAGKLEIGEEPVSAACAGYHAKVVLVASNAAENSARRAKQFSEKGKAPCVTVPFTKEELGWSLGRSSCAILAMMDNGLAASFLAKLAQEDPERYGEAAGQLAAAAAKTLQRQKELAAHERQVRKANSKPWAAPPAKKSGKQAAGAAKRKKQ